MATICKTLAKKYYLCTPNCVMQEFDVKFKEFNIAFVGLKHGLHEFDYHLDGNFFQKFEHSPLHDADLALKLDFVKSDRLFNLTFQFEGTIQTECDRCLAQLDYPISTKYEVVVKVRAGNHSGDHLPNPDIDDLDIVYITPEATHINVAQLVYEFAVLSMPVMAAMPLDESGNPNCPTNAEGQKPCNERVLALLRHSGDKDKEGGDDSSNNSGNDNNDDDDTIDPRWAALKKLK